MPTLSLRRFSTCWRLNMLSKDALNTIAVLLSEGVHPLTGGVRRARADAAAVAISLRLKCKRTVGIHAGNSANPVLRQYLGMGLREIRVIPADTDSDVGEALAAALQMEEPLLVLCGERCETGEGSGFLPYLLAQRLGWPIVSRVVAVQLDNSTLRATQRGQAGARRLIRVSAPALLTVGAPATPPGFNSFGLMRKGRITVVESGAPITPRDARLRASPARRRPKRSWAGAQLSSDERLRRMTGETGSCSAVYRDISARDIADRLLADLRTHGTTQLHDP
jgi:electron transfer flavoprotein beta subunit